MFCLTFEDFPVRVNFDLPRFSFRAAEAEVQRTDTGTGTAYRVDESSQASSSVEGSGRDSKAGRSHLH